MKFKIIDARNPDEDYDFLIVLGKPKATADVFAVIFNKDGGISSPREHGPACVEISNFLDGKSVRIDLISGTDFIMRSGKSEDETPSKSYTDAEMAHDLATLKNTSPVLLNYILSKA